MADVTKSIAETVGRGIAALKVGYEKGIHPAATISMQELIDRKVTKVRFKGKVYRFVVTEVSEP